MSACPHQANADLLAEVITDIDLELKAARSIGAAALEADLEHSAAMTQLAMQWNHQEHREECHQ